MVSESLVDRCAVDGASVLILIVVEYGLGVVLSDGSEHTFVSLNPYCSGIWSRSI